MHTLADLWTNLRAGLAFAFFRPRPLAAFRVGLVQALLLLSLGAGLTLAFDWAQAGADRAFDVYGLSVEAALLLTTLLAAALAALAAGRTERLTAFIVLQAAAQWPLLLAGALFHVFLERSGRAGDDGLAWAGYLVAVAWGLALSWRVARRAFGAGAGRTLAATALYGALTVGAAWMLPATRTWYAPAPDARDAFAGLDVESLYYAQPALSAAAGARLARGRAGVVELYFIGFAGDATEDVFFKELAYIGGLFERRFGSRGRTLLLVNNLATTGVYPLANGPNLARALEDVGARMDREEDVLFLYLTSHGSRDHRLSARFPRLAPNDLSPRALRAMLDASGIRHRVLVISACYSGGFVDALASPTSLVITAAARDKTSFGCGTGSDFTYFGDAYFRRALEHFDSFIDAFQEARHLVAARERAEGLTPSEPQMAVGEKIAARLRALRAGQTGSAARAGG